MIRGRFFSGMIRGFGPKSQKLQTEKLEAQPDGPPKSEPNRPKQVPEWGLSLRWAKSPIASVQRTWSTLASHSAVPRGTNTTPKSANHAIRIAAQRTQGLRGPNSCGRTGLRIFLPQTIRSSYHFSAYKGRFRGSFSPRAQNPIPEWGSTEGSRAAGNVALKSPKISLTLRAQRLDKFNLLKCSISLEMSNLAWTFQSDYLSRPSTGFGGRLAWNFQSQLKYSIPEGDLEFFNLWALRVIRDILAICGLHFPLWKNLVLNWRAFASESGSHFFRIMSLNFWGSQRTLPGPAVLKSYGVVIYYHRSNSLFVEISSEFSPGQQGVSETVP